jgi:thioredoxin 1
MDWHWAGSRSLLGSLCVADSELVFPVKHIQEKARIEIETAKDRRLDELEQIRLRKMRDLMAMNGTSRSESNSPKTLTDAVFDDFVHKNSLAVVDCWAEWCGPCRMIAPVIEELAKEFSGKVSFGKLNVDQNPATAARFRIMSIPTLLIMKDGALVDMITGAVPRDYIVSRLKPYL